MITTKAHLPPSADSFYAANVIGHARNAQLQAKDAPFTARRVADRILQLPAVALRVRLLDGLHVHGVPVVADKARDEQLAAQVVLARGRERVVQQQGVSHGSVYDAVEDMGKKFALAKLA